MWPFILIGLIIYLILIAISVCIYPFICAGIASASKRFSGLVTGLLLLLTLALYLFACTTLENSFDNWCYSVYAGVALTPIFLYFSTGLEEPGKWPESGVKARHDKITIPILTFLASSIFTVEGVLRMAHSYSAHRILNFGWGESDVDSYRFYYEEFHYAGGLLFFISLFSALVIGTSFYSSFREYRRKLAAEEKKKIRIERDINEATRCLKADSDLLMSFDTQLVEEIILCYNEFCQKIIDALKSSDEKKNFSFEYKVFNNIETSYKVLLLTNKSCSYFFYPMGIVRRDSNDAYKYIRNGSDTVSVSILKKNRRDALPSDIQPISQYWQHSCLDGTPDLRYKYNAKTYIYEYGRLSIASLVLHVFRVNSAKDVVSTYNKLYSYISQLKQQKRIKKENALLAEKVTTSNAITENKESVTTVKLSAETKTEKEHVVIDNPKTLEECFSVIILQHGMEMLKDNKLVGIISSYKDVDISEYKDVLEGMVSNDFLYQFTEPGKQNDFALYNLSSSFARQKKVSAQRVLFITQALVSAIKKSSNK